MAARRLKTRFSGGLIGDLSDLAIRDRISKGFLLACDHTVLAGEVVSPVPPRRDSDILLP
jgi:hypothetical protein